MIKDDDFENLKVLLKEQPFLAHTRSADGRGPMFWAHEHGREKIVQLLKEEGVSESRTDANGRTPLDTSKLK